MHGSSDAIHSTSQLLSSVEAFLVVLLISGKNLERSNGRFCFYMVAEENKLLSSLSRIRSTDVTRKD